MTRASTPTLLSLDKWAAIMGIQPAAFSSGTSGIIFPPSTECGIWYQYAWQSNDQVSREELATEIASAEAQLADYLGWTVAPTWIAQDVAMMPRFHRPEYYSRYAENVRHQRKGIKGRYGKIIEPGQRAVLMVEEDETPVFTDADGDGFSETVTVTSATTLTDECEIKVYFANHNGDPEWEIRPARTKTITGGNFVATFWAWQFVDPDYWEMIPTVTTPDVAVDLDGAVYVRSVDVYREYNDPTATSAVFYWEPEPDAFQDGVCCTCGGTGCTRCTLTEQEGCAHIRDAELGILAPAPGSYDDSTGAWSSDEWTVCRDPDQVKLYYYCGDLSWLNLGGRRCDGLSDQWARIIARLAAARLKRPICACGSAGALIDNLQTDLAQASREASYTVLWEELSNPFGTRRGEMEAWRYVRDLVRHKQTGAGAVG